MKKFLALGVLWVFLYAPACEGAEVAGGTSYKDGGREHGRLQGNG